MHSALEEENTFTRMRVSLGIYKQVTLIHRWLLSVLTVCG